MTEMVIPGVAALESELCSLDEKIKKLLALSTSLENEATLTRDIALEADLVMPSSDILRTYYSGVGAAEKHALVLEEMSAGVMALVAAAFAALVALVIKLISWLKGDSSSGGFTGGKEQVTAVHSVLADPELHAAVDDAIAASNGISLEDFHNPNGVDVAEVFESFKSSLTEPEVDFLTSGQRYKVIKDTVQDFTRGNFPEFVKGIGDDISRWVEDGLRTAPHVGKEEDVVASFAAQERRKLKEIESKYAKWGVGIEHMACRCREHAPKGSYDHLTLFKNKPSTLFPHLDHLWKNIRFDQIDSDDRQLITSLEKIKQQFEQNAEHIKARAESRRRPWPAEEALAKIAHDAHRDAVKYISSLVRVGGFIRGAMDTAYHTTMKSFGYIQRIMNAVSKLPNVDRERINRAIDTLKRKRQELDQVVKMA